MTATFMPKPFTDRTGSGLHLHLSLWREGEPLFPGRRRRPARPGPVAAGLLVPRRRPRARLRAAGGDRPDRQLLQADRRHLDRARAPPGRRGRPATAATTAPTSCACPTVTGSSCAAATAPPTPTSPWPPPLAAGLDGIDRGPGPRRAPVGQPARTLPPTLLHAVDALSADPVVAGALDAAGPGVSEYFAARQARGVPRLAQRGRARGRSTATYRF